MIEMISYPQLNYVSKSDPDETWNGSYPDYTVMMHLVSSCFPDRLLITQHDGKSNMW